MRAQLADALARYGRLVYSNSLGAEAMVLTDIIWTHFPAIDIFSIDTGRLHEETYELLETLQRRYQRRLRVVYPDARALETLVARQGVNGFYDSLEARLACCRIRKVEPFRRAIAGFPAWVTGVRREQSSGRAHGQPEEWDARERTLQGQPAAGLERGAGVALHPRAPAAVQCAARPTATRASAARPAPVPSSRARAGAPAAGGGSNPSRANAACIQDIPRRPPPPA